MKLRDIIAVLLLVAVAIGGKVYRSGLENPPSQRRPDPGLFAPQEDAAPAPPRGAGKPLPPESQRDPAFVVNVEDKATDAVGTAFSVNRSGVWVTARHVTEGCDLVALQKTDGKLVRVRRIAQQQDSDISVLWTRGGTPALPVVDPTLKVGEDGYSFGFPQGNPGDVHARIIGRRTMMARGRYNTEEPVVAWTQVRRMPDRGAHLGGISGGPWVNAAGEVVGVHVAGAPRRGRSYSTAPRSLKAAFGRTGVQPAGDPGDLPAATALTPEGFPSYGDALRRRLTVAKVVCLVGEKWRRLARERDS